MADQPVTPPSVDVLPETPVRGDRATFRSLAEAFNAALSTFRSQLVALAQNAYDNSLKAYNSAVEALQSEQNASSASDTALAASNFKGEWSGLTGSLSVPAAVSNDGKFYMLLTDLVDITTMEPGVTSGWETYWEVLHIALDDEEITAMTLYF